MSLAAALKTLSKGARLAEDEAWRATAALLDGGVPELEQGALLALLEAPSDDIGELSGSERAIRERSFKLTANVAEVRPIVFGSHVGTAGTPNLLPLLALALQRLKLNIVVEGVLSAPCRVVAAQVFRELGLRPCLTLGEAQSELERAGMAFVPTAVVNPGLAELLALRGRMGFGAFAERLARFVDPYGGEALVVIAAADEEERRMLRALLRERGRRYLLLDAAHGDAFADPRRRPALELIHNGKVEPLFVEEGGSVRCASNLPPNDPRSTAEWTQAVLRGEIPMPMPLVNQIACCLYGAGYTLDMNQAKAIAAVQTGSLLAA